jgi:L-alanine-DL-glutamate epimerase-like enolase superfamily enzyme
MTLRLRISEERWPLQEPFEIAGQVMIELPLLLVELTDRDGVVGRGEAAGVDYDGETPGSMRRQIESVASQLHAATTSADLAALLPRGGARNALDCAWWDLQAKRSGVPAWISAGLQPMRPLLTACTIGLGSLCDIRRRARSLSSVPLIKVKVDGSRHVDWIRVVREEAPLARLVVDANQSWTRALIEDLMPELLALGVEFIEQPVMRDRDDALDGLRSPIPIVADESCTDRDSLQGLLNRYQGVNIKLDKCGGLTEALALARGAQALGLDVMVGNMCGTSLGMAPAFLVAQLARWVDLDGPLLQKEDRPDAMRYVQGTVEQPSPTLWG